jgi:hypothetical protein
MILKVQDEEGYETLEYIQLKNDQFNLQDDITDRDVKL